MIMSKKNKIIIASSAMAVLIAATIGVSVSFVNAPQDVAKPDDVEIIIENAEPTIAEDENETFAQEEPVVDDVPVVEKSVPVAYEQSTSTYTQTYSTPTQNYNYNTNYSSGVLTPSGGVNSFNGNTETYYNLDMSGVIANAQNMGIQGEYWVRDDGVKMYGDYVIVAAQAPKNTIIETSLGIGLVLDYCPSNSVELIGNGIV